MRQVECLFMQYTDLVLEDGYSVKTSLFGGDAFLVFWEESEATNLNLDLNFPNASEESQSSTIQENLKTFSFGISFLSEFCLWQICNLFK